MKKNVLLVVGVVIAGVAFGLFGPNPAGADKPERGPKPPKKAIEQLRSKLERPDALDPDSTGGNVKPGAGLALVLRDPETGDVLREADGKPRLLRNADGSVAQVTPEQIPPEQLAAQAKHQGRIEKADKGDRDAQAHLANEQRKTADAVRRK